MKKSISEFVAKCLNLRQVNVEHQRPNGLAEYQNFKMEVGYD